MTAPEDVYVAAATALVRNEGVNDGYIASTVRDEPFRAAVDVAYARGIEAAAREIAKLLGVPEHEIERTEEPA